MTVSMKIVAILAIAFMSSFAHANLILNGGFEDNSVDDNRWKWFISDDVNNWTGSNIEIWDSLLGVHAYEGENHAELNAHPYTGNVFTIFQTFTTMANEVYDLGFAYRARRNNNEAFRVEVVNDSSTIFSALIDDHTTSSWELFSGSFTATDTQTTLKFTSVTPSTSTVGNFLDAISVERSFDTQPAAVSSPNAVTLMLLGLTLIVVRRFTRSSAKI